MVTQLAKERNTAVDEPLELYEDPDRKLGPRPQHDLSQPAVQKALLEDANSLPGPDVANVWIWENPCTSFCDFNLLITFLVQGVPQVGLGFCLGEFIP